MQTSFSRFRRVFSFKGEGVRTHREAYALCAGFAIGLINLGAGNERKGYYYDQIVRTLQTYMLGGQDPLVYPRGREPHEHEPPVGLFGPRGLPFNGALGDRNYLPSDSILLSTLSPEDMEGPRVFDRGRPYVANDPSRVRIFFFFLTDRLTSDVGNCEN